MPRLKSEPTKSPSPSDIVSSRLAEILSEYYSPSKKKSKEVQLDLIDHLFESYANKSSGLIEPEGIETLCEDVRVDSKDIRILIFAWKMEAKKRGFISKDEWRRGLKFLRADTITELRKEIDVIEIEVMRPGGFEEFYSYTFKYNLIEDKQRTVDIETACEMLNIVLRLIFPTKVDSLIEFLKIQNEYGALSIDQWRSFYRFFNEVNMLDLQSYDSSQSWSWPVIIDNFVEWLKAKENKLKVINKEEQPIETRVVDLEAVECDGPHDSESVGFDTQQPESTEMVMDSLVEAVQEGLGQREDVRSADGIQNS